MGFGCGLIGLPNVGKSTLFNALTASQAAQAANFPFCTIEPNIGKVAVPDARLDKLASVARSARIIPNQLDFIDIAGLVRGASSGEGLGNRFLANIREVEAICHVVRCFELEDISHVEGEIDPVRDCELIETELMLADLDSLERRIPAISKRLRSGDKALKEELEMMERVHALLATGKPARLLSVLPAEVPRLKALQLLTLKPVLYVANVSEEEAATGNRHTESLASYAKAHESSLVTISAKIEAEVAALQDAEEQSLFLESLGLRENGLSRLAYAGHRLLSLLTFFTVGPKEARAWTVRQGAKAPEAAGVIHSDFERGFIAAETLTVDEYLTFGGEAKAREAGKLRLEGRDYLVQDGDVMHFRFNV